MKILCAPRHDTAKNKPVNQYCFFKPFLETLNISVHPGKKHLLLEKADGLSNVLCFDSAWGRTCLIHHSTCKVLLLLQS